MPQGTGRKTQGEQNTFRSCTSVINDEKKVTDTARSKHSKANNQDKCKYINSKLRTQVNVSAI